MRRGLMHLARPWVIIALTILANLAIPRPSQADWDNDICIDPVTEELVPCCTYCLFFCHCDEELLMP
jgi:hypothetical protein